MFKIAEVCIPLLTPVSLSGTHLEGTRWSELTWGGLHTCETSNQKQCEWWADTGWDRYWLWPQLTSYQGLHLIDENRKVPNEKTALGFGGNIYSKTKSAGYSRRETRCNGCDSGTVEVKWKNIKEYMLDTLSVLVEERARKSWFPNSAVPYCEKYYKTIILVLANM